MADGTFYKGYPLPVEDPQCPSMGRMPCSEKVGLSRRSWTLDEDRRLIEFMIKYGRCCWRVVPKLAGLSRCGKSCRLRWTNYLRPDLKRGVISSSEEKLIIDLHSCLGNSWSKIAAHLPGRTDNDIKNYWNTHIKKKLRLMGIDPATHRHSAETQSLQRSKPSMDIDIVQDVVKSMVPSSSEEAQQNPEGTISIEAPDTVLNGGSLSDLQDNFLFDGDNRINTQKAYGSDDLRASGSRECVDSPCCMNKQSGESQSLTETIRSCGAVPESSIDYMNMPGKMILTEEEIATHLWPNAWEEVIRSPVNLSSPSFNKECVLFPSLIDEQEMNITL